MNAPTNFDAHEDMARHIAKANVPRNLRLVEPDRCQGYSFCQGQQACEGCERPAEMSCTTGDESRDDDAESRRKGETDAMLVIGLCALVIVGIVCAGAYFLAEPVLLWLRLAVN